MMIADRFKFFVAHGTRLSHRRATLTGFRLEMKLDPDDLPEGSGYLTDGAFGLSPQAEMMDQHRSHGTYPAFCNLLNLLNKLATGGGQMPTEEWPAEHQPG
ncbi:hypothetical protein GPL17_33060 [Bradyrhizobium yuanmingense]|uniref:hypothetical protein n=1 Tax=Bradyrhizobium yuanmingense TaxID=108015 RepID=UPI0012FC30BC|nr:hypothetical protein [Bradyrhizobium yuanmingense]MVT55265.1 hypothetical protein [Bradyrhizobium yuanmingense]